MHALQLGKKLAAQRKQLSLHRHPLRTLYYFSACAASAAVRGCLWLAKHRITLTLLLPAIIGYVFLKQTGTAFQLRAREYRVEAAVPAVSPYARGSFWQVVPEPVLLSAGPMCSLAVRRCLCSICISPILACVYCGQAPRGTQRLSSLTQSSMPCS